MPRIPDVCPSARHPLNSVSLIGNSQFVLRSVLAATCVVFFFTQVVAQSATATLSGAVIDQNGAVVPNARSKL
jgi:hypothetical protein